MSPTLLDSRRVYVVDDQKPATRRNYAVNPRATALVPSTQLGFNSTRWGSDGTYAAITGQAPPPGTTISTAVRWTTTVARAGHGFHISLNPEAVAPGALPWLVGAGETWTISCWVRYTGSVAGMAAYLRIRPAADAQTWIGGGVQSANVPTPSGQWVRLGLTYTAPPGATTFSAYAIMGADAVADTFDATGLLVERAPEVRPYFDPAEGGAGFSASWDGAPNASTSTALRIPQWLRAAYLGPARLAHVRTNHVPNPALAVDTSGWSGQYGTGGTGTFTRRTDAGPAPGVAWGQIAWTSAPAGGNQRIMIANTPDGSFAPGDVATISAYVWSPVATPLRVDIDWEQSGGTYIQLVSGVNVNVPADTWTRISLTTPPAPALTGRLRPCVRYAGDFVALPTFGATRALAEKTSARDPYFDGTFSRAEWAGAPHSSASTLWDRS